MKEPGYPAARVVSPFVHAHFLDQADRGGENAASVPGVASIEQMIDAAFWTSVRREEGYVPRISLAFLAPQQSVQPLRFERPLPLSPDALVKVGAAAERAGIHIGVWPEGDELRAWGLTTAIPPLCFVLEVTAPGLLVIKHQRGQKAGKYVNVAVLEGDQIKIIDERASSLPDCPSLISSLLGFESPSSWTHTINVLVQLAVSMREHARGGLLLLVPAGSSEWSESIVQPLSYAVSPPFSNLARLARETPEGQRARVWEEELNRFVDAIGGLTAVDGATVMNSDYELLGFGAKVQRRKGSLPVDQVAFTEPIAGNAAALVHPEHIGGTRHLAGAQFTHDQHDALALVASQDGRFTVFAWSPCENMVHAHRVDSLLL
ncbi:MAG: putative sensor domain DACNV-containing protein [Bryobacteraceae bacterium]|jgi:uncharacterized protein YunC (DUF1805 family)